MIASTYRSTALGVVVVLSLAAPVAAQLDDLPLDPVSIRISIDVSEASTRLVLTHSRPVEFAVIREDEALNIVYTTPIRVTPASRPVDDLLLGGWTQKGDNIIELILGPSFNRHETFELRNPWRLVVDLLGSKSRKDRKTEYTLKGPTGTIIVVDPGHGGVESGAIGPTGLREKDVALELARRLKTSLERDPAVTVVLTREDDRFVELDERTAIANNNRANLFLSIHLNSSRRRSAHGAETYYLSTEATDDEARTLAALENKAHGAETTANPARGEKNKEALELILWDLAQNRFLAQSALLAESVQSELNHLANTNDRGVRQAPFRVLMGATMPAILVEVGFISNAEEELLLKNPQYHNRIVEALSRAVRGYLDEMAALAGPAGPASGGALEP